MSESSTSDTASTSAVTEGITTMAASVVAAIAGIATRSVPGVIDLSDATGAASVQGLRRSSASSQSAPGVVATVGETEATIDLALVAEHGTDLTELVSSVRRTITSSVLQMTGLRVTEVNITVLDTHGPSGNSEHPGRIP